MRKLKRNLLFLFGTTISFITALVIGAVLNAREELNNNELSQSSFQRIMLLDDTRSALLEAESSQRAHIIAGDPGSLQQYEWHRLRVQEYLEDLENTRFPPDYDMDLVKRLRDLIAQRVDHTDSIIQAYLQDGHDEASRQVGSGSGKLIMDQIRSVATELAADEQIRLEKRNVQTEGHSRRLIYLLAAATILTFMMLSGAFYITRRALERSDESLARLQNSTDEIRSINQLSSSLQSCATVQESAEVLTLFVRRLFPGVPGGVYLMRHSKNLLELLCDWSDAGTLTLSNPVEPHECWALRLGQTHLMFEQDRDLPCKHVADQINYICVPLLAQSEIIGLLHLRIQSAAAVNPIQTRAELLATHISAALAGLTLREALRQQTIRDPLTGLYNRRYMEESIERELLRAKRSDSHVSVIMLDVDHFKRFNDQHSHQAGDLLLQEFSEFLRVHVRGEDIACRYGGEEFLLVLPGATARQAGDRAEALRQGMVALKLIYNGTRLPAVTASFGVATFPQHGQDREAVIRMADAALYHSKRHGRDRVTISEDAAADPVNKALISG